MLLIQLLLCFITPYSQRLASLRASSDGTWAVRKELWLLHSRSVRIGIEWSTGRLSTGATVWPQLQLELSDDEEGCERNTESKVIGNKPTTDGLCIERAWPSSSLSFELLTSHVRCQTAASRWEAFDSGIPEARMNQSSTTLDADGGDGLEIS
ncbi:hypothetical protein C8R45DRAFT_945574 [Mycena sanguinolenta]|nr:hypothetical protein C8R45DRAFT_945574 [Mycena sanguinolenta]